MTSRFVLLLSAAMVAVTIGTPRTASAQANPYPPEFQAPGFGAARDLAPEWTASMPRQPASASIAPDGSCVALLFQTPSPGRVVLVDGRGGRAWDFAPPQVLVYPLAVAPGCAWVAFDASEGHDSEPAGRPAGYSVASGVVVRRRDGSSSTIPVNGRPDSIAISHAGDLLAIGTDGKPNLFIATPDGRVVSALDRSGYATPQVRFSADDQAIVVTGWYGVGIVSRAGQRVWGPNSLLSDTPRRTDWRRIDASRDLQWFAAQEGPMHGPQGGVFAILSSSGETVWQGPPVWSPEAKMAPDGTFMAAAGRERRAREEFETEGVPGRLAVIDRSGKTMAAKDLRSFVLEGVSADSRYVVCRESDAGTNRMRIVGRDKTLATAWSAGPVDGYAVNLESGLIVTWMGGRISAYRVPR